MYVCIFESLSNCCAKYLRGGYSEKCSEQLS